MGDWGRLEEFRRLNVEALRLLLDAASEAKVERLVHVSSLGVYEGRDHHGTDESTPPAANSLDAYTRSKTEAEALVLDYHRKRGLPATVVRPGFIYGERDRTVLPKLLTNLRRGTFAFFGSGEQRLNCVYVKNLVQAIFLAAESPAAVGEVFNITDGGAGHQEAVRRTRRGAGRPESPDPPHPSARRTHTGQPRGGDGQAGGLAEASDHQQGPIQVPRAQPGLLDRKGAACARVRATFLVRGRDGTRHGRAPAEQLQRAGRRVGSVGQQTPGTTQPTPGEIPMSSAVQGKRVAVLVEKFYEDLELWYPVLRLREAGCDVKIVGPKAGETYTSKHGYPAKAEVAASEVKAADFDGIVIPGGYSPDHMRRHPAMVDLVTQGARQGKVLAAICHGPWMLCSAKCLKGRKVTGFFAIRDDVENAGGIWQDEACVRDGNLVTSRTPDDLPAFMQGIIAALEEGAKK